MPLTGVAGWPVGHSRSPALHAAAFADLGLVEWHSQILPIPTEVFVETVKALPASGFVGINVTIPHKEAALLLADESSDDARAIGAANTLTLRDGKIFAANTDAPAVSAAVAEALEVDDLSGLTVGVMGAGGSARAAAFAALNGGAASVRVWNRNIERAAALADSMPGVDAVGVLGDADVLINTTPVGLLAGASVDDLPGKGRPSDSCQLLVDLVYSEGETDLVRNAQAQGVRTVDGLEILVRQGALSIELWTGRLPRLDPLREAVSLP